MPACGTADLVGLQLFRTSRATSAATGGQGHVPDINKTFSGSVTVIDENTLTDGLLIGRVAASRRPGRGFRNRRHAANRYNCGAR